MPVNHEYLPMSLVTFSKSKGEEPFLLYSRGFENGPGIKRDGQGSPWMVDPENLHRRITDPHEQRKNMWLLNPESREAVATAIPAWRDAVEAKRKDGLMEQSDAIQRLAYYDKLGTSLGDLPDYESKFKELYPHWKIVGMQGCGNLSMNEWYVAYLRSPLTDNRGVFIALPEDRAVRVPPRQYTCLTKYLDGRLRIQPLVFNLIEEKVLGNNATEDITDRIEFAVYGTQVLRDGELVDFSGIVEQIADVRHLFRLPNLNPNENTQHEPHRRPRRFFGERQYDDVWFGEAELLTNLALRRAALTEPVLLNRQFEHMGADTEYVREILGSQGYREDSAHNRFLRYSDGTWRYREETDALVEIKLFRNVYAYSLIGLDAENNVLALAVGGLAGRRGQTLEAAVQNIRSYGARDALLIDQGDDVFQYACSPPENTYKPCVHPLRHQLRATFVFAAPTEQQSALDA